MLDVQQNLPLVAAFMAGGLGVIMGICMMAADFISGVDNVFEIIEFFDLQLEPYDVLGVSPPDDLEDFAVKTKVCGAFSVLAFLSYMAATALCGVLFVEAVQMDALKYGPVLAFVCGVGSSVIFFAIGFDLASDFSDVFGIDNIGDSSISVVFDENEGPAIFCGIIGFVSGLIGLAGSLKHSVGTTMSLPGSGQQMASPQAQPQAQPQTQQMMAYPQAQPPTQQMMAYPQAQPQAQQMAYPQAQPQAQQMAHPQAQQMAHPQANYPGQRV